MDNVNKDFDTYYTHHIKQQHQQHQQPPPQHHHHQNQPIGQPHHQGQHIGLADAQHRHSVHDTFDQQAMLNLVPTDLYSSSHFMSQVNANPNMFLNAQYKSYTDNQSLYLEGTSKCTIPHQADRSKSLSYMPSSQSFQDNFNVNQLPQRRNSDMAFSHDHNNSNSIDSIPNNYIFSTQQPQGPYLLNEANTMVSPFEHSQSSLASSSAHSNFQPKPRREQDVFGELLSMATKNISMGQAWQNHDIQYSSFSSSSDIIQSQQHRLHHLPQQHDKKEQIQYNVNSSNPIESEQIASAAAAATLAASSRAHKKSLSTSQNSDKVSNYDDRIYELSIAQQPSRARMCGFGDKDRRPISPPPIVKLVVTTGNGQVVNPETFDTSFLVVMCDSCQETDPVIADPESTMFENPLSQVISYPTSSHDDGEPNTNTAIKMRNLVGSSVSSASKLYDLDGKLGIFFVFQDVSLRTEGCFRLKFSLVDVGMPHSHNVNTTSVSHVLKVVYTDPFIVYTAKKFPGVVQSTLLSKCFARQGIKIPIRKEKNASLKKNKARQTSEATEQSEDEDY